MLFIVRIIMLLWLLLIASIRVVISLSIVVIVRIRRITHLWRTVVRVMLFSNCSHGRLWGHVAITVRLVFCHFPLSMIVVMLVNIVSCGNSRGGQGRRRTSLIERIRLIRVVMVVKIAVIAIKSLVATIISSGLGKEGIGKSCADNGHKTTNRSHNYTYITATL